jgi:hypothetical protein
MTNCKRCGSIQIRAIRGGPFERAVALLLWQRVLTCGRCGWRGRGSPAPQVQPPAGGRTHRADAALAGGTTAGGQAASPRVDLGALDQSLDAAAGRAPSRRGRD